MAVGVVPFSDMKPRLLGGQGRRRPTPKNRAPLQQARKEKKKGKIAKNWGRGRARAQPHAGFRLSLILAEGDASQKPASKQHTSHLTFSLAEGSLQRASPTEAYSWPVHRTLFFFSFLPRRCACGSERLERRPPPLSCLLVHHVLSFTAVYRLIFYCFSSFFFVARVLSLLWFLTATPEDTLSSADGNTR